MNRDIKFRGKQINTKKWVYGYLYREKGLYLICENIRYAKAEPIILDTVGQYIGLHDKNGKGIYEGDIVTGIDYPFIDEGKQSYVGIVAFYDDVAQFGYEYKCVKKNKRGISNGINNEFKANENLICEDLEVIGNIYDNPELLEGE